MRIFTKGKNERHMDLSNVDVFLFFFLFVVTALYCLPEGGSSKVKVNLSK